MSNATSPGYQRLIAINGYPLYLDSPFSGFPTHDVQGKTFVQGGPRNAVYFMGERHVKGSFSCPMFISSDGDLDPAVKEILTLADYPLSNMRIDTNYVHSGWGVTDDVLDINGDPNKGFGPLKLMSFEGCGITSLKVTVPNEGPVMLSCDFVGLVSRGVEAVVDDPEDSGLMRANLIFANCDVYLEEPEFFWDTSRSFEISVENKLEPVIAVLPSPIPDALKTDQPRFFSMMDSSITATISYSVDRGILAEQSLTIPTGGYVGKGLVFDFYGLANIRFPHCVMKVTEQPITLDLLERKTEVRAMFESGTLSEDADGDGRVVHFPDPLEGES
jgi:hypothetical protein